jgi:hypothetical protein
MCIEGRGIAFYLMVAMNEEWNSLGSCYVISLK